MDSIRRILAVLLLLHILDVLIQHIALLPELVHRRLEVHHGCLMLLHELLLPNFQGLLSLLHWVLFRLLALLVLDNSL